MASETRVRHDPDGVRSRPRPGEGVAWLLWPVLVFVLLALGVSVYFALAPVSVDDVAGESASSEPETVEQPPAVLPPVAGTAPGELEQPATLEPDEAGDAVGAGEQPTGIALFPPRGTKPIKRGIIVPEDFPLPPGYVRHYQTTDEGQQLPAILLFHPDYVPRDASGAPIPVPPDRVVPPELAPPGLPIQMLDPAAVSPQDDTASPRP